MKRIICLVIIACWINHAYCQTKVEKTVPVKSGQKVSFIFTWPELIKVETWDKNEVGIEADVTINNGQNDDSYRLNITSNGNAILIESEIQNHDQLPRKIMIKKDGETYFFDTDDMHSPAIKQFKDEHGDIGYDYTMHGVLKEIYVTIKVPQSISLDIEAKFGMVEVRGFNGEMNIHSKFGGIDVAVGNSDNTLRAGTKFGEKYTNLEGDFETIAVGAGPGKWDWVSYPAGGGGKMQELKSEFGNIYMRKL